MYNIIYYILYILYIYFKFLDLYFSVKRGKRNKIKTVQLTQKKPTGGKGCGEVDGGGGSHYSSRSQQPAMLTSLLQHGQEWPLPPRVTALLHLPPFPDCRGKPFRFFPLSIMFTVGLSYIVFIMLRYSPLLRVFIMKRR